MTDAKEYGKALFLLTEEEKLTESILADLKIARDAMLQNPTYEKLLDTPALSKAEKIDLIDKAFSSLHELLSNFMKLLCEKRAIYLFPKAVEEYLRLYDESRGIERVEVVTAIEMTESQKDALTKKLAANLGKTIVIKNTVDKTILGGVKLRYAGIQLDGSVQKRLESFEKNLKNIVI